MPYQGRLPYTYKSPYNTTLDQGTQTVPSLAFLGDTNNGVFSPATDNVAITTNGSEKLRVTSGGFVGIGTTNPGQKLDVHGRVNIVSSISGNTSFLSLTEPTNTVGDTWGISFNNPSWGAKASIYAINDNDGNGQGSLIFQTQSSNFILAERLRITSNGNIGIGTTNPSEKLHVYSASSVSSINIDSGNSGTTIYYNLAGVRKYTTEYVPADDFYSIGRSGVAYDLTLKNGNIGIGTTNPEDRLDLASGFIRFKEAIGGTGTYGGIRAYNSLVPSVSATAIRFIRDVAELGNDGAICFDTTNNERVRISSTGNVGIGTTNPATKLSIYSSGTLASFSSSGTYGDILLTNTYAGGTVHYIGCYDASLRFYANSGSVPTMTISGGSPGNVGIGTINPLDKLHVSGGNIRTTGGYLTMFGLASPNHENYIQMSANGVSYIGVGPEANPTIKFKVGNTSTTVLNISSTAVTPGADNTYNLGSTSFRWANIYSADLQLSNKGSSNDVDGTWGAYTIQEGENDLYLLNRRNGKKYKFVLQEVN